MLGIAFMEIMVDVKKGKHWISKIFSFSPMGSSYQELILVGQNKIPWSPNYLWLEDKGILSGIG